jgi:hypothetical protein
MTYKKPENISREIDLPGAAGESSTVSRCLESLRTGCRPVTTPHSLYQDSYVPHVPYTRGINASYTLRCPPSPGRRTQNCCAQQRSTPRDTRCRSRSRSCRQISSLGAQQRARRRAQSGRTAATIRTGTRRTGTTTASESRSRTHHRQSRSTRTRECAS